MIFRKYLVAGSMVLALAFTPVEASLAPDSELESLVLVLNVISTTHARPATGVVLSTPSESGAALVVVPVDFVSAGDKIVVLDGGKDILRNGRPTRTVARSFEAGVALLEVEGLQRGGVELSADTWPPAEAAEYLFAAWPPAEVLAEGAPMIQRSVRLEPGPRVAQLIVTPELPQVSGPLFDHCGRMAALHLGSTDARLLGVGGLVELARSVDSDVSMAVCEPDSPIARSGARDAAMDQKADPARADDAGPFPWISESIKRAAGGQSVGRKAWWLVAVLIGLAGIVLYLRIGKRKKGRRILLQAQQSDGPSVSCEVSFPRQDKVSRLERAGLSVEFRIEGNRAFITQLGEVNSDALALAVGGTPCLPGEVFTLSDGEEIQLADERFVARLELDQD